MPVAHHNLYQAALHWGSCCVVSFIVTHPRNNQLCFFSYNLPLALRIRGTLLTCLQQICAPIRRLLVNHSLPSLRARPNNNYLCISVLYCLKHLHCQICPHLQTLDSLSLDPRRNPLVSFLLLCSQFPPDGKFQ